MSVASIFADIQVVSEKLCHTLGELSLGKFPSV
jgi:hypothetical protein